MKYIIVDKDTKKVVGDLGGYTTKKGAINGRFSTPQGREGWDYVRDALKCPPGEIFRENLYQYMDDHLEIVEVNKICFQGSDGRLYAEDV
jgi:hypothetical protein